MPCGTIQFQWCKCFIQHINIISISYDFLSHLSLPFDQFKNPTYGFVYVATASALFAAAIMLVCVASLFVCFTTHFMACLSNIRDSILFIDNLFIRFAQDRRKINDNDINLYHHKERSLYGIVQSKTT